MGAGQPMGGGQQQQAMAARYQRAPQGRQIGANFEVASQVHDQLSDMRKDLADVVARLNAAQQQRMRNKAQSRESQIMATLNVHLRTMQKCEAHVVALNQQYQLLDRKLSQQRH